MTSCCVSSDHWINGLEESSSTGNVFALEIIMCMRLGWAHTQNNHWAHWQRHMASWKLINIGSGNSLLPGGTKPLLETNVGSSPMWSCGIHLKAMSIRVRKYINPYNEFYDKNLTLQPHLLGVNELTGGHHFPLAGYSPYHFLFDISFRLTTLATMTSSNGNIFCVTGPFTGHRWIPFTKSNDAEFWCFHWSAPK